MGLHWQLTANHCCISFEILLDQRPQEAGETTDTLSNCSLESEQWKRNIFQENVCEKLKMEAKMGYDMVWRAGWSWRHCF